MVVLTNASLEEQKRINTYCHQNGIKFIYADTRGVFATAFVDFGENFKVFDIDGEQPSTYMIDGISQVQNFISNCLISNKQDELTMVSFFFLYLGRKWNCDRY